MLLDQTIPHEESRPKSTRKVLFQEPKEDISFSELLGGPLLEFAEEKEYKIDIEPNKVVQEVTETIEEVSERIEEADEEMDQV